MSKTVKIPDYMKPNYVVTINGVRYSYPAGTVQTVPDSVAGAIQHYYDSLPKEDPPETTEEMIRRICGEMIATASVDIIAQAKLPDVVWDLSEVALASDQDTDVTEIISVDEYSKYTVTHNWKTPITAMFAYDDDVYSVSSYYTAAGTDTHFIAYHLGASDVPDGILDLWLSITGNSIYARLSLTELTNNE